MIETTPNLLNNVVAIDGQRIENRLDRRAVRGRDGTVGFVLTVRL
jgi:hypothetical protein